MWPRRPISRLAALRSQGRCPVPNAVKSLVPPVYLFACLILGGSAQGVWQNMLLQLAGLGIIAWTAAAGDDPLPKAARSLLLILVAGLVVVVLQLFHCPRRFGRMDCARGSPTIMGCSASPHRGCRFR